MEEGAFSTHILSRRDSVTTDGEYHDGGYDIDLFLLVLVHDLDGLLTKGWILLLSICKWMGWILDTSSLSYNSAKPHTWL